MQKPYLIALIASLLALSLGACDDDNSKKTSQDNPSSTAGQTNATGEDDNNSSSSGQTGINSGTSSGEDPGTSSGEDPGTDPGTSSGEDPGTDPGTGSGEDPGTDPGTSSGEDPGTDPGTSSGEDPSKLDPPPASAETAIGAACDEDSFADQCHAEMPVYCYDGAVESFYEADCASEGMICGLTKDGWSECFEPCSKSGEVKVYCQDDNKYNGTVVTDTCTDIGYGRLGYTSEYTKCSGACENGKCKYDYSSITELGTKCSASSYTPKCSQNAALHCEDNRVNLYEDCSLNTIYNTCAEYKDSSGKTKASCYEACTQIGAKTSHCSSSATMLFQFTCKDLGNGVLMYDVSDYKICTCKDDVCVE